MLEIPLAAAKHRAGFFLGLASQLPARAMCLYKQVKKAHANKTLADVHIYIYINMLHITYSIFYITYDVL